MSWTPDQVSQIVSEDHAAVLEGLQRSLNFKLWLGRVASDSFAEDDSSDFTNRLDGLLESFGAETVNWQTSYIGAVSKNLKEALSYQGVQSIRHKRLGEFVAEAAYFELDIENEEYGDSSPAWYYWLGKDHIMAIECEGEHWTNRVYKHPVTGAQFCPDENEINEFEMTLGKELEYVNSEVEYRNDFYVVIQNVPKGTS